MKTLISFATSRWVLDEVHGLSHWRRVEENGIRLAKRFGRVRKDVNLKVVRYFAYLHDLCRYDNGPDLDHGPRAADFLHEIRHAILKDLTEEEFALLETACRFHTTLQRTGIPTVDVCFDADRLDLGRVGIRPDPRRMATRQGRFAARWIRR